MLMSGYFWSEVFNVFMFRIIAKWIGGNFFANEGDRCIGAVTLLQYLLKVIKLVHYVKMIACLDKIAININIHEHKSC